MTVEARSVVVRLSMEAAQYIRDAQKVGTVTADAMIKVEKSTMNASRAHDQLAGTAGKVGIAAAVGVGAVISATANFDQAMSSVQAATHETAASMDALRQAALDAGADTAFSATEAAGGIEALAKAGISTTDILDGGLTGALDLAAAGGLGVADAAEAAAGALAQFKLEGDQASHVADLLAAGAGKAQGDVSDMVMALKQAGTVASQTGLSLEETVGALSAMAEQSLLGSDAGTSFKTMLAALTPNSTAAADAMQQYNIHAFDAQGNFVGMTELAGQLRNGLGDLTDEQRAMALETIFGSDAVRAASIIFDNGAEGVANWTSKVNDAGFAAETASIKQDNLRGDLEKLGGALSTALIGSGDGSTGFLRSVTQGLTKVVDGYSKLPASAQTATTAVMAGSAVLGGSIWVGSKLVRGIADTREALDQLNISGGKWAGVAKGIGTAAAAGAGILVLAGALTELSNSFDETLPGAEELEGRLIGLAETPTGFSATIGSEFDSIGDSIDRVSDPSRWESLNDNAAKFNALLLPGDQRTKGLREATAEIEALDTALANLVSGGNADVAADALANLADQYGLTDSQVDALKGQLTGYNEALAGQANDAKLAAAAGADVADANAAVADSAADASAKVKDFGDTLDRLNEKLDGRADLRDYQAAIDDFTDSIKENGNTFDINSAKGRENQARLDAIAGSALSVAENMRGAARTKFLTNAIDDIRTMGETMGLPKSEVKALIELLREANNANVKPKISADTGSAMSALQALRQTYDSFRDKTVRINVTSSTNANLADVAANTPAQRRAGGGQILGPGTTTSDSIPILASNKEYVVQAAAVDHYGVGFFDAANAMRLAGGGSTDGSQRKPPKTSVEQAPDSETDRERQRREARERAQEERADRYYQEQERAQRDADRRAEDAAKAEQDRADEAERIADAVFEGQQRAWDQATDAAKAQKDAAQSMVDSVKANMDRLGQAAVSGFNSPLFKKDGGQQHGMWVGGASSASGWRGALTGDISGLQERSSLIDQLSGAGLSAQALETLLGQADNAQIRDLLASGEVGDYARLFEERARLTGEVSGKAGMAGYGQEWAAANAELTRANGYLEQLVAYIASARPISVTEAVSAEATAAEVARLLSMGF